MAVGGTKVVQVTNIAPQATKDQMQTLFGFLGKIDDIRLYPTVRDVSCPVQSRICYIKFMDSNTVGIAQHMTNTVFIDRALIVIPVQNGDIPDEYYALEMSRNGTIVPGLCPSEPKLPANVINTISGAGLEQVILTADPQLDANALPAYPPLPVNYDSAKIEEIRRTVLLGNVDMSTSVAAIADFFSSAGEIKYARTCRRASDGSEYFLVEFSEQASILNALKMNGSELNSRAATIRHATQAIVKPQAKSNEAAQREIEEAMSRVKEAQNLISATIDPVIGMLSKDKRTSRRSRSRSRGRRRRSRSRSRTRRSRSRGGRRRSRSRSRDRRRRSRSRHNRSRSRSRRSNSRTRRSRSRSQPKNKAKRKSRERRSRDMSKERSRDKSRERSSRRDVDKKEKRAERERDNEEERDKDRKRSRSPSKTRLRSRDRSREKGARAKDKKRSRSRDRERERKRRSTSREKRHRSRSKSKERKRERKERKERSRSKSRSKVPRNYDEEEKGFDSEKDSRHSSETVEKEPSVVENSDNMDISNSP